MALSPELRSAWLPLPRTTTVVLVEDVQVQPHTQQRRCPALPTQNLFPPAHLDSHRDKTLRGQKFIQHPASQSQKHGSRPLAQPGVVHFMRTKIIRPHSTQRRAPPQSCTASGRWDASMAFPPEPSSRMMPFLPKTTLFFPTQTQNLEEMSLAQHGAPGRLWQLWMSCKSSRNFCPAL